MFQSNDAKSKRPSSAFQANAEEVETREAGGLCARYHHAGSSLESFGACCGFAARAVFHLCTFRDEYCSAYRVFQGYAWSIDRLSTDVTGGPIDFRFLDPLKGSGSSSPRRWLR